MTGCKGVQFHANKEALRSITEITDRRNIELSFLKCLWIESQYLLMLFELDCKKNYMKAATYFQ